MWLRVSSEVRVNVVSIVELEKFTAPRAQFTFSFRMCAIFQWMILGLGARRDAVKEMLELSGVKLSHRQSTVILRDCDSHANCSDARISLQPLCSALCWRCS